MSDPAVTIVEPSQLDAAERASFEQLVRDGGQVNHTTFPALFENARALALAKADGVPLGVAALKRPNDSYRASVFRKAGSNRMATEFPFELGWVFVAPMGREKGLVGKMLRPLLTQRDGQPVYATSALNKERMHAALRHVGFVEHGRPYDGEHNEYPIQLFVLD